MRFRARISEFEKVIIDFSFEIIIATWGLILGIVTLLFSAPSETFSLLPSAIDGIWATLLIAGAISIFVGILQRKPTMLIPAGLWLYTVTLTAFAIAVFGFSRIQSSGVTVSLALALAAITWARARGGRRIIRVTRESAEQVSTRGGGGA